MTSKLRAYESATLAATYSTLSQIIQKITETMEKTEITDISNMPPSIVPTQTLYEIAICYDVMYNKLIDKELIEAGQHVSKNTTH